MVKSTKVNGKTTWRLVVGTIGLIEIEKGDGLIMIHRENFILKEKSLGGINIRKRPGSELLIIENCPVHMLFKISQIIIINKEYCIYIYVNRINTHINS